MKSSANHLVVLGSGPTRAAPARAFGAPLYRGFLHLLGVIV